MTENGSRGPTWAWVAATVLTVAAALGATILKAQSDKISEGERDNHRQDIESAVQSYRISVDSALIVDFRKEMNDKLDQIKLGVERRR